MNKYFLGQKFSLVEDIQFETSTVNIEAEKGSEIEIIEIDDADIETPYKVYFSSSENWVYLSEGELENLLKV